jgi:outer membrane biosynthesis protein TonB
MSDNTSHTWEKYEKQNKRNGAIISFFIHAVVIALFFFFGLSSAFPPPVEGILINFGTTESGGGDTPPEVTEPVKEVASTPAEATPSAQQAEQEIVTQDVVEAPAVKKPEKKNEVVKPIVKEEPKKPVQEEVKKPVKEEPKVDASSMYTGQTGEDNPSDEGITYGPGDQGDPEGDVNSDNYDGENTGLGNVGIGHDLAGRSLLFYPPIDEKFEEAGKVAMSVKVDRSGKVISATFTQKGSTTANQKLIRLAKETALQARFSPNSKVAEEQFGTIIFTFKLK